MSERIGPLATLANRLFQMAPYNLSTLKVKIFPSEDQLTFMNLVEEFLPERQDEILKLSTPGQQTAKFASYFEDRYFPLADFFMDEEDQDYSFIAHGIPLVVQGIGWEQYEQIPQQNDPGEIIATYLVNSGMESEGSRVTLAEACAEWISQDLLVLVPKDGLSTEDAHRLFDDTPYKGIAIWADILNSNTGNYFLDTDDESYSSSSPPEWDMDNVKELTRLWKEAEPKQSVVYNLWKVIDKEPVGTLRQILHIINPEMVVPYDPNQLKFNLKFDSEEVQEETSEAGPAEVPVGTAEGSRSPA